MKSNRKSSQYEKADMVPPNRPLPKSKSESPSRFHEWARRKTVWYTAACLAYYLALPPLQWPWMAYVSGFIFVAIVDRRDILTGRDYLKIWLAGCGLWLGLLQGIRLAYWPLYAGWVALSLYLAVYVPLFVYLARGLSHRFRFPLFLACPIAWVTCEMARSYFITGFAGCLLAHSQTPWPSMLQIGAHFGGYGVSFVVMLIAATFYQWISWLVRSESVRSTQVISRNASIMLSTLVVSWSLGTLWTHEQWLEENAPIKPLGRFLLVQDHMLTMFDATRDSAAEGEYAYENTTRRGAAVAEASGPIDVVVWPESVFAGGNPWFDWDDRPQLPAELEIDINRFRELDAAFDDELHAKANRIARGFRLGKPRLLVGSDVLRIRDGKADKFNAAIWMEPGQAAPDYYAKHHLVMFGEYIPVVSWIPGLLQAIGLGQLSAGETPKAWSIANGRVLSPSICFEDVVPQLIQRQTQQLAHQGTSPDVLINVTNDGWFRGSSILDHHLNNAIMLAVENRRPVLIAANTGITAWIDGNGRVIEQLQKMTPGWILAEPVPDGRDGLWQWLGDLPARVIAAIGFLPVLVSMFGWIRFKLRPARRDR